MTAISHRGPACKGQTGAYRAQPSRRSYIPEEDGSRRPLAITALEDEIVQRAVAAVLNVIYEEDPSGSRMGFGQGVASTVRWMHW